MGTKRAMLIRREVYNSRSQKAPRKYFINTKTGQILLADKDRLAYKQAKKEYENG